METNQISNAPPEMATYSLNTILCTETKLYDTPRINYSTKFTFTMLNHDCVQFQIRLCQKKPHQNRIRKHTPTFVTNASLILLFGVRSVSNSKLLATFCRKNVKMLLRFFSRKRSEHVQKFDIFSHFSIFVVILYGLRSRRG